MKKGFIIILAFVVASSMLLASCQSIPIKTTETAAIGGVKVLAAESFLADIAQNVAGDRVKIDTLMPLGMDPHAFEPVPQDVAKIADSTVLIINGAGFEGWLQKVIDNVGGNRITIEAAAGLKGREAREGEEAMLSEEERVEQICANLDGKKVDEKIHAGDKPENSVRLHEKDLDDTSHEHTVEIITVGLNQDDGKFGGYFQIDVEEDGDFLIATESGSITITNKDGKEMEVEDTLTLGCQGLAQASIAELEPGEYQVKLSEYKKNSTLLFAGAAAGHHHHDGDPHFWLDPISVIQYTENIRNGLIQVDPAGKDAYTKNAETYIAKLKELDASLRKQADAIPVEKRLIVTNHESFGYFADRYGFKIIGTIIPSVSTGASPSAQQLARLVDRIRSTGATAIFLETGTNPQLAEQISKETGIKVVTELYTHSITSPDGKAPTYIDMMKYNMNSIIENLK